MNWKSFALTGACAASLLVATAAAEDQRTVWDGVYSSAQAARGEAAYASTCSRCHGATLEGDHAPSLVGDTFMRSWGENTLAQLFAKVQAMPPKTPADRADTANVDLVAYLLQANRFPAGPRDLERDSDLLARIQIVEKRGEPIPNFSLVRTVGCLTAAPDAAWILTRASEPVRTHNPAASTGDELKDSQDKALGTARFSLLSLYPSPEAHAGHRMEVKGFLIRNQHDDRINVSSIQMMGATCVE